MIVTELKEEEHSTWDAYVKNSVRGLPWHLSGWQDTLYNTYGFETHFLMAKNGASVVGVLPLFVVHSMLVGNSTTSIPGGLCADDTEAATALIQRGREVALQAKSKRFVLQDTRKVWPGELHTTSNHVHWAVDIRDGANVIWKRLGRETRRMVRVARKNGLTAEIDHTGERLGDFYHVLSHFLHSAGTPAFGKELLEQLIGAFAGDFSIAVVYKGEEPLGAYFQLMMRDTVYGLWGATLHEYLRMGAAYLAYWEILCDADRNGYDFWDLGRSPVGSNSSKFKTKWGSVPSPVYQQVEAIGNKHRARSMVDRVQEESKFQRFIQVWSKLPFPVVQFLGPKLRRHVPFA